MPSSPDNRDATAVLLRAKTPFEGETIAAALRELGIEARVLNSASWQATSGMFSQVEVVVLGSQLDDARAELERLRADYAGRAWEIDAESPDDDAHAAANARPRHGRFALTVAVFCVPLGLLILSAGTTYRSPPAQVVGGVLLVLAMVIVALRFLIGDGDDDSASPADDARP